MIMTLLHAIGWGIGFGISFWVFLIPFMLLLRRDNGAKEFNRQLMERWKERNELHVETIDMLGVLIDAVKQLKNGSLPNA